MLPDKEKKKLRSKALNYCSKKEACRFDVEQKLKQWGADSETIDDLIDEMLENDFINENRYAKAFCNDKIKFNRWGKQKVMYALLQKQVAEAAVNQALAGIEESDYKDMITEEIRKKAKSIPAETDNIVIQQKLSRFAQSRGYEKDISIRIIEKEVQTI